MDNIKVKVKKVHMSFENPDNVDQSKELFVGELVTGETMKEKKPSKTLHEASYELGVALLKLGREIKKAYYIDKYLGWIDRKLDAFVLWCQKRR